MVPLEDEAVFFGREGAGENDYAYGSTYAQAGMAIAKVQSKEEVVLGSPGSWNWTGTPVL